MTVKAMAIPIFDPGGLNSTRTFNQVQVIQSEGMHDTAIVTLRGQPMDAPDLQPGTPMQMQYGWANGDMEWFYGYIDHTAPHYDWSVPEYATYEDVVCLGASYGLKDPFVGAWTEVQASSIVTQIANQYYLSVVAEDDDTTWPQLSSPGSSAWSYLVTLANKVGYSLACNKTQLRFLSVDLAMRSYWRTMPVFKSKNAALTFGEQGISRFQALTGEALNLNGHTKAVRQINGLDLSNGHIIGAINDGTSMSTLGIAAVYPFFGQQISDTVVTSQGNAQAALAGLAECNRFNYQATATLAGMTAVKQGTPVVISGIDANNDGAWWVQEVTHKITVNGYSMDVCLGRDSKGDSGLRPLAGTAVAFTPANPLAYSIANAPPTKLINKRWRAAWQSNVNVT